MIPVAKSGIAPTNLGRFALGYNSKVTRGIMPLLVKMHEKVARTIVVALMEDSLFHSCC